MDVGTITMPKDEAEAKLAEYRDGLAGREATDEDKGIVMGLKALAAGKAVLDLDETFRRCPADAKGRPALAVARAHWRYCFLNMDRTDAYFAETRNVNSWGRRPAWHRHVPLPRGVMPAAFLPHAGRDRAEQYHITLRAVVPLIPPNLRPAKALPRYRVLFEAEWEPVPPTDPLLIRHLHGSLYVVLAAWDLTALERAVLAGRLGERPN